MSCINPPIETRAYIKCADFYEEEDQDNKINVIVAICEQDKWGGEKGQWTNLKRMSCKPSTTQCD